MLIVLGTPTAATTIRFLEHVVSRFRRSELTCAVSYRQRPRSGCHGFRAHLTARTSSISGSRHALRTTTPSANASKAPHCRNAGGRRSTAARFNSVRQLQQQADAWLVHYNTRRRNHSDYMRGRTPAQILDNPHTTKQHDQHQQDPPPVTSNPGPEALGELLHEREPDLEHGVPPDPVENVSVP
jgi:hypothetical protein